MQTQIRFPCGGGTCCLHVSSFDVIEGDYHVIKRTNLVPGMAGVSIAQCSSSARSNDPCSLATALAHVENFHQRIINHQCNVDVTRMRGAHSLLCTVRLWWHLVWLHIAFASSQLAGEQSYCHTIPLVVGSILIN